MNTIRVWFRLLVRAWLRWACSRVGLVAVDGVAHGELLDSFHAIGLHNTVSGARSRVSAFRTTRQLVQQGLRASVLLDWN